eukprot:TRINITY_DN51356_c0_g2_i1.p2 TRINITY_DN51356_c0_g2~~TRINITY_DN51356_c0_g2_i1.p2  ORF type:complete len:269 (+),score=16.67 TRINITY_DN51356_c0_g2_i1:412-1218(+)
MQAQCTAGEVSCWRWKTQGDSRCCDDDISDSSVCFDELFSYERCCGARFAAGSLWLAVHDSLDFQGLGIASPDLGPVNATHFLLMCSPMLQNSNCDKAGEMLVRGGVEACTSNQEACVIAQLRVWENTAWYSETSHSSVVGCLQALKVLRGLRIYEGLAAGHDVFEARGHFSTAHFEWAFDRVYLQRCFDINNAWLKTRIFLPSPRSPLRAAGRGIGLLMSLDRALLDRMKPFVNLWRCYCTLHEYEFILDTEEYTTLALTGSQYSDI